jgi:hypothetical protein
MANKLLSPMVLIIQDEKEEWKFISPSDMGTMAQTFKETQ